MSSSTFTRYECDWCRAEVEITHSTFPVAAVDRPREWARAQLEEEAYDLCAYCAEALRGLKASRGAPAPAHAMESEFVAN